MIDFRFRRLTYLICRLQKSCDLGAQFSELEKKQISLNFDLELAKKNLKKAQDEATTMGGKHSSTVHLMTLSLSLFFSLFEPSDSTRTDVHSENR